MKPKHPMNDPNLPRTFEKIHRAVNQPLEAANNSMPNVGFAAEARKVVERGRAIMRGPDATTERGRARIAADAAARKGIAAFPPARLLKGGHK